MLARIALITLLACACGGSDKHAETPDGDDSGSASAATPDDDDDGREPAAGKPVSEAECIAFFDHVLELQLADMRAQLPPDEVPTDVQVAEIKKKMIAEDMGSSSQKQPRELLSCAMAATSIKTIRACQPPAP